MEIASRRLVVPFISEEHSRILAHYRCVTEKIATHRDASRSF
jgi:hypothetical protein